jgi:tetratricopeptide (TPR) repeat protein
LKQRKRTTPSSVPPDAPAARTPRGRLRLLLPLLLLAGSGWWWLRHQTAVAAREALALGTTALSQGNVVAAEQAFGHALQLDPGLVEAHTQLGRLAVQRDDQLAAILHFSAVTRARPVDAEALTDLGIAHLESGDWTEAQRAFAQAVRIAPNSALALRGMGETYRRGQRWEEAIAALERSRRLQPEDARTLYFLGLALAQRARAPDDLRRAAEALAEARRLGMVASNIDYGMGLVHLAEGRLPEAIAALEATVHAAPENEQALYRLGEAYRRAGRTADAARTLATYNTRQQRSRQITSLRQRVLAQPDDTASRRQLAAACVDAGSYREAAHHLLVLVRAGTQDPHLYDLLARAWDGLGLKPAAEEARRTAAQLRDKVTR